MEITELLEHWLGYFNKNYGNYNNNLNEPRYEIKTFFLYSYNLFNCLNGDWNAYLNNFVEIFKCDPSNDYYGYRSPFQQDERESRRNSLEWANLFEISNKVGYPHNYSAEKKMLKHAKDIIRIAKTTPLENFHDIMLSAGAEFLNEEFENLKEWILEWLKTNFNEYDFTVHQLIAFINAIRDIENESDLKNDIIPKILDWIHNPSGTERRQILIWARIIDRLYWCEDINNLTIHEIIKQNFLRCLEFIHNIEWVNSPLILEAAYVISDDGEKQEIEQKIRRIIITSYLYDLREIFPFLNDTDELNELQPVIEEIGEKCNNSPSNENCHECITNSRGLCWIRIFSLILEVSPRTHSPFEVADVVIYTLQQGIYFVIKSENIGGLRSGGDILFRQCSKLFLNKYSLVIYVNPRNTHPAVIEHIRNNKDLMRTNPQFIVLDRKFLRQIYRYYDDNFSD